MQMSKETHCRQECCLMQVFECRRLPEDHEIEDGWNGIRKLRSVGVKR